MPTVTDFTATLTAEDVYTTVAVLAKASEREESDLRTCTIGDLQLIEAAYRGAVADHEKTGLENFVVWLQFVSSVVGPAVSIVSAVTAGIGLVGAIKAL
jgi:hypothetical protein